MKVILVSAVLAVMSMSGSIAVAEDKVSPETVAGTATVDAAQAKALFDKGVPFIDVRSDKDYQAGRIPDAVHLELKGNFDAAKLGAVVGKDKDVVFYCNGTSCLRSSEAAVQAVGWGFTKVHYFRLGFPAWKAAGYPAE